jgi:cyclophilin family peptidyl-prolyl cis-trans isomerase
MARPFFSLANLFRNRPAPRPASRRAARRLGLEVLEDRTVMSASPAGTVSGIAFVDSNGSGTFQAQDFRIPGVSVTLTGTTGAGAAVNANTQTDGQGAYSFSNVLPGSYRITFPSQSGFQADPATGNANAPGGTNSTPAFTVGTQQSVTEDIAFGGLAAPFINLSMFLNTSTSPGSYPVHAAGSGTAASGSTYGPPTLVTAIPTINGAENTSNAVDLDAYFGASSVQNQIVQFNTSKGTFNVQLFDKDAPITAANFLAYVESGSYDNSIFHRETSGSFIQGGGFTLGTDSTHSSSLEAINTPFPSIGTSEFNSTTHPRTAGTLALALAGNSGSSGWFFNLADNTNTLAGNYTVFGQLVDASGHLITHSQVLDDLAAATPVDQSTVTSNTNFQTLPLAGGPNGSTTGSFPANDPNFPADAAPSNFDVITSVEVISPASGLKYTAVSNNPTLVTPTIQGNMLTLPYVVGQTGSATITVTATDAFGVTATTAFQVNVTAQPTVTSAPITPNNATATTSLKVDPTGINGATGFTYQWVQSNDNGLTFQHVSGLTQAQQTLTLPANLPAGVYQFEVFITPTNATRTVSGPTFTTPPVTITSDGAGNYTFS